MLDPDAPAAFKGLQHMLVGGEALPASLARQLTALVPKLHDVYGPTETTVWSTTHLVGDEDPVPIGKPLANQRVYVLDQYRQPVSVGHPGDLWIGGDGVTAGYFRRPELTAECFVPDPFDDGGTMYRTGDLARWQPGGVLEYLGRTDHQVKVRGYRIELGEIQAELEKQEGVNAALVVVHDENLVAFVASGMDDSSFSVVCVYDTRLGFLSRFSTFTQLSATSVLLLLKRPLGQLLWPPKFTK